MKLSINPLYSDIFITIYVVVTLFIRFKFEHNNYAISPGLSLVFGLCCVAFLWSLIKLKILNPNWFGLFNSKKSKH
ncbi:hypothetical protein [Polaribacter sp. R77954]|uniref:hypothetical protein n=1 Tax=Polaribacter sp. R77954 TaxID=3093870 RepID=UPI0037CB59F3